jgi:nitrite reductase/ring-hydroxylating ferredoxin subunit
LRRHGGTIEAVQAWCPHAGGPLGEGGIEGDEVTCPWHGSRFCLRDGRPTQGPASAPLRTFDVREAGGRILVKPNDEAHTWPPAPEPPPRLVIAQGAAAD